jgi:putative transcriptional regulator
VTEFRLCNRLKVARAEKNLSQEKLALLAGVTRQTIGSIETGQYNPSALLALTLAQCLEKRVEDLFYLEEKP